MRSRMMNSAGGRPSRWVKLRVNWVRLSPAMVASEVTSSGWARCERTWRTMRSMRSRPGPASWLGNRMST